MTSQEHYDKAEALLAEAFIGDRHILTAQVHAILALVATLKIDN